MAALRLANRCANEGARQRDALVGRPMREVIPALINPSEELASLRLKVLFRTRQQNSRPIPRLGERAMNRAFAALGSRENGDPWNDHLKLRELTENERRRLVRALVQQSRPSWRKAA
jgi:hypothetical protein